MKLVKTLAVGSMLLGLMGTAYAEDGFERARQFKQNFLAEQARLWGDGGVEQKQQQIAQRQQEQRDVKDAPNKPSAVTKDFK
ncbi:hypothetical protein NJF54_07500 [Pseudomonas guariconensis]|uniref:hypothetical protein n=1 Tax=Pseudomonas TaxID=286 RepID=UPI001CE41147|nr:MULTISPECIES: hypothetical protein [Pseudomonas]MCO7631679.1 hypothetical protein [Pseudomonas guariconensis]